MSSQPLVIVGFPGIGKTSLVEQLGSYVAKEYSFEQMEHFVKKPGLNDLHDFIWNSAEPIIVLPCHLSLLVALDVAKIKIWTALPDPRHKREYLNQLTLDGKEQSEIDFINEYYTTMIGPLITPPWNKEGMVQVHGGNYKMYQSDMLTAAINETIRNWKV